MGGKAGADTPASPRLLLVANGAYAQEDDLEAHFEDSGFEVTVLPTSSVTSTTPFSSYHLVVVTGFTSMISTAARTALLASDTPILVIAYWDMEYAHALGVTTTSSEDYRGRTAVTLLTGAPELWSALFGTEATVYSSSYTMYGVSGGQLATGVTPLLSATSSTVNVAFADLERRIGVYGAYDTTKYTTDGYTMLDFMVSLLAASRPATAPLRSYREALQDYADSGIPAYLEAVMQNPQNYTASQIQAYVGNLLDIYELPDFRFPAQKVIETEFPGILLPIMYIPVIQPPQPHHPRCRYPDQLWMLGESSYDRAGGICTEVYHPDYSAYEYGDTDDELEPLLDVAGWPDEVMEASTDSDTTDHIDEYYGPVWNSTVVSGVDMGVSVVLGGKTFLYTGDGFSWSGEVEPLPQPPDEACPSCLEGGELPEQNLERNDYIAQVWDLDPSNGVDITVLREDAMWNVWSYRYYQDDYPMAGVGLMIPGFHVSPYDATMWNIINLPPNEPSEPKYSTVSGAAVFPVWDPGENAPTESVVMWYSVAGMPNPVWKQDVVSVEPDGTDSDIYPEVVMSGLDTDCNDVRVLPGSTNASFDTQRCLTWSGRATPRTFMAGSSDGVGFRPSYVDDEGRPVPFSEDSFTWTTKADCLARESATASNVRRTGGKFLSVTPVAVPAETLNAMCNLVYGNAKTSVLCAFYSSIIGPNYEPNNDGVLLYGTGRPYGRTPLFLAYIKAEDIGVLQDGRPKAYYFNGNLDDDPGDAWSSDEDDAVPLPQDYWGVAPINNNLPCDEPEEFTYTYGDYLQDLRDQGGPNYTDAGIEAQGYGFDCYMTQASYGGGDNHHFSPESCMPAYAIMNPDEDLRIRAFVQAKDQMIGMMSAKLIELVTDSEDDSIQYLFEPTIVMLYNRWADDKVYFNAVPLKEPWNIGFGEGSAELEYEHNGYGPFILEQYTTYKESTGEIILWHTLSSWWGPAGTVPNYNEHPYGVYTTSTIASLPCEVLEVLP